MGKLNFPKYQFSMLRKNLAIDMGTTNTLIYVPRHGIVLQEPSVVAVGKYNEQVLAVGKKALLMLGKTPADIEAIRPLQNGVIADFKHARLMLQHFLWKVIKQLPLIKMRAIITVPYSTTQVERQAIITAAKRIGIKEIYLIEEPLAAAIGTGIPIEEKNSSVIINLGGGVTEVAAISFGGIVYASSIRQGGSSLDAAIQRYLYHQHSLEIGFNTAEAIKKDIGYAYDPPNHSAFRTKGLNWQTLKPDQTVVTAAEINEAITPVLYPLTTAIKEVFENVHPQFASDVYKRSILLVGGGALLKNIDVFLQNELKLPVQIAQEPLTCTISGASKAIRYLKHLNYLELYRA